ncbi:hypothetical protein BGX30_001309 [Mortierella sp. GBA39]|nr:hypothetical protein BGX30_001309 [Mortierella sp. GBA39]
MCCSCVFDRTLPEKDISTSPRARVRIGQCGVRTVIIKEVVGNASSRNLMEIRNSNIIQFFHHCSNIQVMDLAPRGTLANALSSVGRSGETARFLSTVVDKKEEIARQISSGLVYLHAKGIVHRKIRTDNILLTRHLDAKIGGFGSDDLDCEDKRWMAPELFSVPPEYSKYSDIFALGVVMEEMRKFGAGSPDYISWMRRCKEEDRNDRPLQSPLPIFEKNSKTDKSKKSRRRDEGLPALELLAREGSGVVANMLGSMHLKGVKVPIDKDKAQEWFLEAAKLGHEIAQLQAGLHFQRIGDNSEAENWFRASADQGYEIAWCALGDLFVLQKRYKEAHEMYIKAATRGIAEAQLRLGVSYLSGFVERDDSKAFQLLQKAADQGHPYAEYQLGCMYLEGQGTKENPSEAQKMFERAANQGVVFPPSP